MTLQGRGTGSSLGIAAAFVAMIGWSASGVITKGLDMPGMSIVFYRMWVYTAAIFLLLTITGGRLTPKKLLIALPGGVALGLDIALFFNAVKQTTIANATIIGALQPLLTLALAPLFFGVREKISGRELALSLVAIVGVGVVLFGSTGLPDWRPRGDILAACGLLAWTSYFLFSKRTHGRLTSLEYTAAAALIATVFNTPIAFASGHDLSWPAAHNWTWLLLMALGPGLIAHVFMNWSLTRIPVWLAATLSLFIPVTSTLMAWLFINEEVAALQFIGMLIVLGSLVAVVLRPRQDEPDAAPPMGAVNEPARS
jgi:drug/metabolite transporter (DMT)-like permease